MGEEKNYLIIFLLKYVQLFTVIHPKAQSSQFRGNVQKRSFVGRTRSLVNRATLIQVPNGSSWFLSFHHQPYPIHWQVLLVQLSNYAPHVISFTISSLNPCPWHHHLSLGTCLTFPTSFYFSIPNPYNLSLQNSLEWSLKNINDSKG